MRSTKFQGKHFNISAAAMLTATLCKVLNFDIDTKWVILALVPKIFLTKRDVGCKHKKSKTILCSKHFKMSIIVICVSANGDTYC